MEWNRGSKNKLLHLWSIFNKGTMVIYQKEIVFSTNGFGTTVYAHAKEA